jgi:uncharacterized membrane protein YedE/YeeE
MQIVNFTPANAFVGGLIIGLASIMLYLLFGKIFGVSRIISHLMTNTKGDRLWRWLIVLGLIMGGFVARKFSFYENAEYRSLPLIAVGSFIMGFGARLGNGCTSGHGVCGISRMSLRSIVATLIFISTGVITVTLLRIWGVQ